MPGSLPGFSTPCQGSVEGIFPAYGINEGQWLFLSVAQSLTPFSGVSSQSKPTAIPLDLTC